MTFDYDEKMKHVFSIQPAVFNSIEEFAKSVTDAVKKHDFPKISILNFLSASIIFLQSRGPYKAKSCAMADLPFDITGTDTVLLYLDIVGPNSVGDVKCPLLRSFPFKHRNNDEIFKRYQVLSYCSFEHLRFHKVINRTSTVYM